MEDILEITRRQLNEAVESTNGYARKEVELREGYSGKFMYGEECFGVVGDPKDLAVFEMQLAISVMKSRPEFNFEAEGEDVLDLFSSIVRLRRTDDMGPQTIFYYPSIQLRD